MPDLEDDDDLCVECGEEVDDDGFCACDDDIEDDDDDIDDVDDDDFDDEEDEDDEDDDEDLD